MKNYLLGEKNSLVGYLFIYLLFRIIFILSYSVELDEAISYFWSRHDIFKLIDLIKTDIHPPLNYIIHKVFDINKTPLGIRWSFFLFFVISIPFICKLLDQFLNDYEKKYFWVLFLFSSFVIQRTTIARMHSITFLLSIVISYIFLRLLIKPQTTYIILFFFVSLFFPLNFYPSISFPFFMYLLLIYKFKNDDIQKVFFSLFFFFLIYIFIVFYLFLPYGSVSHLKPHLPTGLIVLYTLFSFTFNEEIIFWNLIKENCIFFLFFLTLFILVFLPFYKGLKEGIKDDKVKYYSLVNLFSFLLILFLSIFIPKLLYSPKYLIHIYPFFIIFLAKGISKFSIYFKKTFMLIYILYNIFSIYCMVYYNREDWKKAYLYILQNRKEDDYVFVDVYDAFCFYYNCDSKVYYIPDVDFLRVDFQKVWIINSNYISRPKVPPYFLNKYVLKSRYVYGNLRIYFVNLR